MKNRLFGILMVVVIMVSMMAGCSQDTQTSEDTQTSGSSEATSDTSTKDDSSDDSESQDASSENEPVTLRFMWWGGDARTEATLAVIEQFEAKYPWISIEPEYGSDEGYNEKLATQFSAQTSADIMQMGVGWMPDYVNMGGLFVDFNEADIDLSGFSPEFLESNGTFDGHVYGLPTGIAGSAIIVNTDLAAEIGIDLNSQYTYYDLIEMGKKVKAYDDELYLLSTDSTMLVASVVRAWARQVNDAPVLNDSDLTVNLSQDQLIELLSYIQALYDNNVIPPASYITAYAKALQTDPNWINGKYVAALCYTSTIEVMAAANPNGNFEPALLPVNEGTANDGWYTDCPQYMTVYAGSEHTEEAVMFLDYFYNDPTAQETLGTVRSIPPTEQARTICSDKGLISPLTQGAVDICLTYNGKSDAGKTTSQEVITILEDMVDNIAFGMATPEELAEETMSLLENYLASQQ